MKIQKLATTVSCMNHQWSTQGVDKRLFECHGCCVTMTASNINKWQTHVHNNPTHVHHIVTLAGQVLSGTAVPTATLVVSNMLHKVSKSHNPSNNHNPACLTLEVKCS